MMSAMRGLVLLNGRVFTARAGEPPFSGGVAIAGDRIVAVGGDHAARAAAPPDSTVIDVGGRSILPGFVDAHHHLAFTGAELAAIDARYPGVASIADLVARVADAAERTPDGQWIRAVGMNPEMFPDGRLPTRWDLDEATRVHPVLVQHMSGHHALANSLGLETRGLTDDARDPEGGHLVRDDRGRLTGYCLDAAQQLVVPPAVDIGHHGPGFHDDAPLEEIVGDIERGSRAALAAGITSIVDAQVTRRELTGYRAARERGLLGVRMTAMPISSQLDEFEELGLAGPFGDDRLAIGPMKFYADGALTGGTAAFTTPYGPSGEFTGSLYWTSEDAFQAAIATAHAAGWQIGVHAQGDRAIDRVLDAYEAALRAHPRDDHRHRIEHCGGPRPDQIARMAIARRDGGRPAALLLGRGRRVAARPRRRARPSAPAVPRAARVRHALRALERRPGGVVPPARHDLLGGHPPDRVGRRRRRGPGADDRRGRARRDRRCRVVIRRR